MREMGSAMMGTGEASGERRALLSAEAAIANPLIYDVSMRGARGVLISITGGRDLTLFEVDQAATRIREEVDPDANVIVGATFDESLEGTIRVSMVATGVAINPTNNVRAETVSRAPAPLQGSPQATPPADANSVDVHEAVIAELARRLKAEKERNTERAEMPEIPARRVAYRG
jgi:cell division protein FtsZ